MIPRQALAALVFLALATFGQAADYTGVVAAGDSLSDIGNRRLDPKKADIEFRQTWVAQLTSPAMLADYAFSVLSAKATAQSVSAQ